MKLNENPYSGSMRTDGRTDRRTDTTKLMFVVCNFVNAPNKMDRHNHVI